ncbi:Glycosyltransferase family 92 protein Os08g0121900 [Planktothrix rubescens]|nr:Glycosyltransferase family 92 protein Os08g0121900 [Planktothrix rubescens]
MKLNLSYCGNGQSDVIKVEVMNQPNETYMIDIKTERFPIFDRSIESVYCYNILQCLSSPFDLFREISRVCVDGASVELKVPYNWNNSAFLMGCKSYYNEDHFMHLCVWFGHLWEPTLGARWLLKDLLYTIESETIIELYSRNIDLEFALKHYKNVAKYLTFFLEIRHHYTGEIIYPQLFFEMDGRSVKYLLKPSENKVTQQTKYQEIDQVSCSQESIVKSLEPIEDLIRQLIVKNDNDNDNEDKQRTQLISQNTRSKCQLSICAILKDESPYLIEWLEFHKIVGVQRFYLYDNGSSDYAFDLVQPYIKSGEVVWHEWLIRPGQISAYQHCLDYYKNESDWIAFVDLDEFLFPTEKNDLKEVLEEFLDYPAVAVNWLSFGSSGHKVKPEGLQIENFTCRGEDTWGINLHIKSIVRPDKTIKPQDPHSFLYVDNLLAVTENKEPLTGPFSISHSVNKLRINHYITRSFQESKEKMLRGRSDTNDPRPWLFDGANRNEVEDLTIQRFVPQLTQAVNAVVSQSPFAKVLQEKGKLNSKLFQLQLEAEDCQSQLHQNQEKLAQLYSNLQQKQEDLERKELQLSQIQEELAKNQLEVHNITEELEIKNSQFDEVLVELEEAYLQLHPHQNISQG